MGRDKALLPWGETTLLDHALSRLRQVCREVSILSGSEARYADRGVPVHVDAVADAGVLGGIYTGLLQLGEAARDRPGLFLAVDIPLAPSALLAHLLSRVEGYDAVVPVTSRGPEPLCAVYRTTCLPSIRRRMEAGEYKMTGFWPDVRVREVAEAQLFAFGDPEQLFYNVNTPEDYERLRDRTGRSET